jgi:hypothetical protein
MIRFPEKSVVNIQDGCHSQYSVVGFLQLLYSCKTQILVSECEVFREIILSWLTQYLLHPSIPQPELCVHVCIMLIAPSGHCVLCVQRQSFVIKVL